MITTAPNPSWRWLIKSNIEKETKDLTTLWGKIGSAEVLTHRTWISFRLIFSWIREHRTVDSKPCVFVPEFYCYDTICQIMEEIDVVYYPINNDLEPDMKACRELAKNKKPDAVVFCHFFGIEKSINDMNIFSKQHDAILIEDAAHVLYSDEIGKYSDFILFSPWKILGLPDGAILVIGKKNVYAGEIEKMRHWFIEKQKTFSDYGKAIKKWKRKKIVMKLLPTIKKGDISDIQEKIGLSYDVEKEFRISNYSTGILYALTKEEILTIGERRKENLMYLTNYCRRKYGTELKYEYGNSVPYVAVYNSNGIDLNKICREIGKIGKVIFKWPSLPADLPDNTNAYELLADSITIAIHQGMSVNLLSKYLGDKVTKSTDSEISIFETGEEEYENYVIKSGRFFPLLQSTIWGSVKKQEQGWKASYNVIRYREKTVACFMILQKKSLRLSRINQGVLWLEPVEENIKENIFKNIKKKYSGIGKLLFFAPGEERNGCSFSILVRNGFYFRKNFYATGLIDLQEKEEVLRKKLDSKWRNQLKKAETNGLGIIRCTGHAELFDLLGLHSQHKKDKSYKDSGDEIIKALIRTNAIVAYVARLEERLVGYVMVVKHSNSATYYIGWSSEEGYHNNANKLLLWYAMLDMKKEGFCWFDVGGIDKIHTQNIADFKLGMGCKYIEYVGEFVNL